jgi:hypothetical protein
MTTDMISAVTFRESSVPHTWLVIARYPGNVRRVLDSTISADHARVLADEWARILMVKD